MRPHRGDIAIIVSDPPRGLLFYPVKLALALAKQGHKVIALTWTTSLAQDEGLAGELLASGVDICLLPELRHGGIRALTNGLSRLASYPIAATGLITFGPISATQAKMLGIRAKVAVCFVEAMGSVGRRRVSVWLGAVLLRYCCDQVFALCGLELRRLHSAGVPAKKLRVVFNPVDCQSILETSRRAEEIGRISILRSHNLVPARRYIGCFANLNPGKRHDILLDAFAQIQRRHAEVDLLLCGAGPQAADIDLTIQKLGLAGRVIRLGRLSNSAAIGLMRWMDVVVQASEGETFGYSLVEPLLLGRDLVTTRVGIAAELESAGLATVVAVNDSNAFALGLERVLSQHSDNARSPEAGRAFVQRNLDVDVIAGQVAEVLLVAPSRA